MRSVQGAAGRPRWVAVDGHAPVSVPALGQADVVLHVDDFGMARRRIRPRLTGRFRRAAVPATSKACTAICVSSGASRPPCFRFYALSSRLSGRTRP